MQRFSVLGTSSGCAARQQQTPPSRAVSAPAAPQSLIRRKIPSMKNFIVREKIFDLGDDFIITDEVGSDRYFVDGKVFTIRDVLIMQDMAGNDLATIRRRLLSFGPTYEIERNGRVTTISKHLFTLFRCRFTVDVPGPNDLHVQGAFLDHEYEFMDDSGRSVATVSKKWLGLTDRYAVRIADDVDEVTILAAVIVIDRCCHERNDK